MNLNEEAKDIIDELNNDPTLKKDVLEGYDLQQSDDDLQKIASSVAEQTQKDIVHYEALSQELASSLSAENLAMIKEDILVESTLETQAEEQAQETEETEDQQELKAALPQKNEQGEYDLADLQSCISALLFYSEKSLSLKKIKEMLEMNEASDEIILSAISHLKETFANSTLGFEISDIAGGFQFRTKINRAPLLRKLAKVQVQRLSRGAMEALTIVAFKQPCTKDDIDQVRGVDSSHFIRTLLDRNLIEVTGRSEAAGRPMIYATTTTFLEVFGMMDTSALPSLSEIEQMVPQLAAQEEGKEDPRIAQMRKLVTQMKEESNHLDYSAKEDEQILADIRDRVKAIDVTTPYLARQKQLAEEGVSGAEAEEILSREFGFVRDADTIHTPADEPHNTLDLNLEQMQLADFKPTAFDAHDLTQDPASDLDLTPESPEARARAALESMDLQDHE